MPSFVIHQSARAVRPRRPPAAARPLACHSPARTPAREAGRLTFLCDSSLSHPSESEYEHCAVTQELALYQCCSSWWCQNSAPSKKSWCQSESSRYDLDSYWSGFGQALGKSFNRFGRTWMIGGRSSRSMRLGDTFLHINCQATRKPLVVQTTLLVYSSSHWFAVMSCSRALEQSLLRDVDVFFGNLCHTGPMSLNAPPKHEG